MLPTPTYRSLAEKVVGTDKYPEIAVPDSLYPLLAHMYTDEEAEIVLSLQGGMKTAKAIAKKVHRPVGEVRPILESLAERILILGVGPKGLCRVWTPGFVSVHIRCPDASLRQGDAGGLRG